MAQWTEALKGKLTFLFASVDDVKHTKEELLACCDYLIAKYEDKPNHPILAVLNINKIEPPVDPQTN